MANLQCISFTFVLICLFTLSLVSIVSVISGIYFPLSFYSKQDQGLGNADFWTAEDRAATHAVTGGEFFSDPGQILDIGRF